MKESILYGQLKRCLAESDSVTRKAWATKIVGRQLSLESLLPLLHFGDQTSQRFMWLLGDICELNPSVVAPLIPLLFSFRSEMPFPGMPRSVAKWLLLSGVPEPVEGPATQQLLDWVASESASISCKSYAAKALVLLVRDGRLPARRVRRVFQKQAEHQNHAYARRMKKLLAQI